VPTRSLLSRRDFRLELGSARPATGLRDAIAALNQRRPDSDYLC
jgi:hypothetical protein